MASGETDDLVRETDDLVYISLQAYTRTSVTGEHLALRKFVAWFLVCWLLLQCCMINVGRPRCGVFSPFTNVIKTNPSSYFTLHTCLPDAYYSLLSYGRSYTPLLYTAWAPGISFAILLEVLIVYNGLSILRLLCIY